MPPSNSWVRLKGVVRPGAEAAKVIGEEFIRVFEEAGPVRLGEVDFLTQGTLYPDVIESKTVRE